MLQSVNDLRGLTIRATNGDLGSVYTFYVDDVDWVVRYLVVDTGHWLPGKRVLIAPDCLGAADPSQGVLSVSLTREQVKDSPDIDTDKPVSRQQETTLRRYYNWPAYWTMRDPFVAQALMARPGGAAAIPAAEAEVIDVESGDPYLRSMREVIGYYIEASDGSIGHVEDFIVDTDTWHVRYMVVDTHNWLPGGKKVLISPNWIGSVVWEQSTVHVALSQAEIKTSPEWHGTSAMLSRDYETELYSHYGRPTYWN